MFVLYYAYMLCWVQFWEEVEEVSEIFFLLAWKLFVFESMSMNNGIF